MFSDVTLTGTASGEKITLKTYDNPEYLFYYTFNLIFSGECGKQWLQLVFTNFMYDTFTVIQVQWVLVLHDAYSYWKAKL